MNLFGVAAEVNDQRIALDVPGVQPRAVGRFHEDALDRHALRKRSAAPRPWDADGQAVLREVQEERQADDDHADDRHRFEHLPQSGFV